MDATRADEEFLIRAVKEAVSNGATIVTICDDAGISLPEEIASLVKKVDKVDMHGRGEDINRDGYTINFRLYYDLFVKNGHNGTIFAMV